MVGSGGCGVRPSRALDGIAEQIDELSVYDDQPRGLVMSRRKVILISVILTIPEQVQIVIISLATRLEP